MYIAFAEDGKAKALDEEHTVTIWCESEEGKKRTMATLRSIGTWVPADKMLPAENAVTDVSEEVLVTVQPEDSDECVTEIGYRYHGHWVLRNGLEGEVKAWMRFPKPYKGADPITVNEKAEIIDGQGRYEALKAELQGK